MNRMIDFRKQKILQSFQFSSLPNKDMERKEEQLLTESSKATICWDMVGLELASAQNLQKRNKLTW